MVVSDGLVLDENGHSRKLVLQPDGQLIEVVKRIFIQPALPLHRCMVCSFNLILKGLTFCLVQTDAEVRVSDDAGTQWRIQTTSALTTQMLQKLLHTILNSCPRPSTAGENKKVEQPQGGAWFRGLSSCVGSTEELQLRSSEGLEASAEDTTEAPETAQDAALQEAYAAFKVL